eukprot:11156028-Alexandrium_andersonii.AAC.1
MALMAARKADGESADMATSAASALRCCSEPAVVRRRLAMARLPMSGRSERSCMLYDANCCA